jgi:sugar lactone lactonase YvrE
MLRLTALVTALALCPSATAQPEFVQLIAGLGVPGNQPGLNANLGEVGGVAVDRAGNVFLSLSNYGIIEKLDTAGTLSRFAGTGTPGFTGDGGSALMAQFSAPTALALDGAGNLYIADTGNQRVRRVATSTGLVTTVAGGGGQGESSDGILATSLSLGQMGGLTADFSGNLYLASGCRIRKVNAATGLISTVVGTGVCGSGGDEGSALAAQIGVPSALAVDSAGNLYLTDNNRVRAVDARSGSIGTLAGTGTAGFSGDSGPAAAATLSAPSSIAVDAHFNVFIADTANQRVRRVDGQSGVIATVAGNGTAGSGGDNGPATAAALNTPGSLAVDASGNLLIADTGNGLIRRVSASSSVLSTIAGGGGTSFSGDSGTAATAQFAGLRGIAIDSARNLYLADTGNCRVRRINASTGYVSTVAGSGGTGPVCGPFGGDNGPATEATLNAPGDVAVDSHGNLFIADTGNARIRKVDANTGIITTLAGGGALAAGSDGGPATSAKLVSPAGLAVDGSGNVFFSDNGDNRVRRVNAGGIISTVAGTGAAGFGGDGGPATAALLNHPAGLALDSMGNLYIADNGNNRVRRVDAVQATISTAAGSGQSGFGGDSGPAVSAGLAGPRGVAVDNAGNLLIADEANNRIRMVNATSGTITTIVGDGTQNSSGDGGLSSSAEVNLPWGLTVAPDQTVYFSENGSSRLRALVPLNAAASCAVTVLPSSFTAPSAGGGVTLYLLSSSLACGWSISNLPNWMSAFPVSGAGPSTVVLTVAANAGSARTATIGLAGTSVRVAQPAASATCTYFVSPLVTMYSVSGGTGAFTVNTQAGCDWRMADAPAWLSFSGQTSGAGPGSVPFAVPANTGAHRNTAFTVAGQTVLIDQTGASATPSGTFSHFVSGAGWQTGFTLVNTGYGPTSGQISFYDENGIPFPGAGTSMSPGVSPASGSGGKMGPGALLSIAAPGGLATAAQQGWAQLLTDGNVNGYEVFRLPTSQGFLEAIAAPETRASSLYMLPFDTTGGHEYGIALVNPSGVDAVVSLSATDAVTGALLSLGSFAAPSLGHSSFVLTAKYPMLANARGILRFSTLFGGQINVIGLRLRSTQSITSVPLFIPASANPLAGFANAGILPQVAAGGGWSTTFAFVNTGSSTAKAHLDFYDDQGAPLPLTTDKPLQPAAGTATTSSADATLEPGTMAMVEAAADQSPRTGWARLVAEGSVSGYALLVYSDGSETREAASPFFISTATAYLLPFDNTEGYANGVGLANNSDQAANVLATLRDTTGQPISSETISLPAWGHTSFEIISRYPATANMSGTVEFSSAVSGQIGVLGFRAGSNHAFTAVPALARQ